MGPLSLSFDADDARSGCAPATRGDGQAHRRSASTLACLFWAAACTCMVLLGLDELVCNVLCCLVYVRGSEEIFERSSRRSLAWRRWRSLPIDGLEPTDVAIFARGATPEFQSYAYRRVFGRAAFLADGLQFIGYGILLVAPSWTALGIVATWIVAHALVLGSWERRVRRDRRLPHSDHPYRATMLEDGRRLGGAPGLPCA